MEEEYIIELQVSEDDRIRGRMVAMILASR